MNNCLKYILVAILCFTGSVNHAFAQRGSRLSIKTGEPNSYNIRTMPDQSAPDIQPPSLTSMNALQANRTQNYEHGMQGIDVSHYQGRVNWEEVARDRKVTFVILKATEGNSFVDNTYARNFSECKRLEIPVGSYHFYRANVDPEEQYNNMMRVINPQRQDILPVIDVELTNGVSEILFLSRLERLCELVTRAYGARPIIYTGRNFFAKYFNSPRWKHYKFWIAAYSPIQPELPAGQDYMMWQYSDKGRVMGIRGDVDLNRFVLGHTLEDIKYHKR